MSKVLMSVFAALLLALTLSTRPAEAHHRSYGFGYYGSGFSLHFGHYPRYRYRYRYYYPRSYGYRHYYYRPRVRRPARHHRHYRYRSNRCSHWASRCAANWGHGGKNFRGCMRYHRC